MQDLHKFYPVNFWMWFHDFFKLSLGFCLFLLKPRLGICCHFPRQRLRWTVGNGGRSIITGICTVRYVCHPCNLQLQAVKDRNCAAHPTQQPAALQRSRSSFMGNACDTTSHELMIRTLDTSKSWVHIGARYRRSQVLNSCEVIVT